MFKSINLKRVLIIFCCLMIVQTVVIFYIGIELNSLSYNSTSLFVTEQVSTEETIKYSILDTLNNYLSTEFKSLKDNYLSILIRLYLVLILVNLLISLLISYLISKYVPLSTIEQENIVKYKTEISTKERESSELREEVNKINSYISHELKNMLNVLSSQVQLQDYEQVTKQIDLIDETIEDLNALTINNVATSACDILELCAEVVDQYDDIHFDFTDGTYICEVNNSLFKRSVINIINNAYKANAENIYVNLTETDDNIVIAIKNDGKKLSKQQSDVIFDYRFKLDELSNSGSGIGLSLVYNVMELFNGTVYVDVNNDVTFYLILPVLKVQ